MGVGAACSGSGYSGGDVGHSKIAFRESGMCEVAILGVGIFDGRDGYGHLN